MSKKYVIDLPDDAQYILINGASENHCYTRVEQVDDLEELNSDYINEHYGSLQDEAYRKGLEDSKTYNGYQDGVGDAWQTINLIRKMSQHTRETRFGANELGDIMGKYTAKELIAMMRPYFEKPVVPHSDRIEAGKGEPCIIDEQTRQALNNAVSVLAEAMDKIREKLEIFNG